MATVLFSALLSPMAIAATTTASPVSTTAAVGGEQSTPCTVGARLRLGQRYALFACDRRPQVTATMLSGFTHTSGTRTISNAIINGNVNVQGGTLILNNVAIITRFDAAKKGLNGLKVTGGVLRFNELTVMTGFAQGKSVLIQGGAVKGKSFVVLGGTDGFHISNRGSVSAPSPFANEADSYIRERGKSVSARVVLEDGFVSHQFRPDAAHTDAFQVDGGGQTLLRRVNLQSYVVPLNPGSLGNAVPSPSRMVSGADVGNGGLILTQNRSNPRQIQWVALYDSVVSGGNFTLALNPSDGLPVKNVFARRVKFLSNPVVGNYVAFSRFGPVSAGGDTEISELTWGKSGIYRTTGNKDEPPREYSVRAGGNVLDYRK